VTLEIADSLGLKKAEGALVAEPQAKRSGGQGRHRSWRRHHRRHGEQVKGMPANSPQPSARWRRVLPVKLNRAAQGKDKVINLTSASCPALAAGPLACVSATSAPSAFFRPRLSAISRSPGAGSGRRSSRGLTETLVLELAITLLTWKAGIENANADAAAGAN